MVFFKQANKNWKYVIIVLIIWVVLACVSVYFTRFKKQITVKEKYIKPGKHGKYRVVDDKGNNYDIVDNIFVLEFDSADDYGRVQVGQTYTVSGYWFRLPLLSWFPRIYAVS
jgi:hypothetical protein